MWDKKSSKFKSYFLSVLIYQEIPDPKIITNINREKIEDKVLKRMLELDILASEIYDLICFSKPGINSDHRMKPYMK